MKKQNRKKGFTIVELVIVIAVIAILAAVLIPTFSNVIAKANQSAALQETRNAWTDKLVTYDITDMSDYDYEVHNGQYTFYIVNGTFIGADKQAKDNGTAITYKQAVILGNQFVALYDDGETFEAMEATTVTTALTKDTVYKVVANYTDATGKSQEAVLGYVKCTTAVSDSTPAVVELSNANAYGSGTAKITLTVKDGALTASASGNSSTADSSSGEKSGNL